MNDELKAAFDRMDQALAEARAALEKPEPGPPSVEVIDARSGATWLFSRIDRFELQDGRWRVWGHPRNANNGYGCDGCYILTDATPFSIWQAARAKGVPCCEPPTVTLHGPHTGNPYRYARIDTMRTVSDGTALTGWRAGNDAVWNTCDIISHVVAESPATIRAACNREGVPCPEEEKPETVAVEDRVGDVWRFGAVGEIAARLCNGEPVLCMRHPTVARNDWCLLRTPIADIQWQAAEAGIDLPPVTVKCSGWTWTRISAVTVKARSNDTLDTTIVGVSDSGTGNEFPLSSARTTPAQVLALCALAGWPKPEVRCEFHYCDGTVCEVDPADVRTATLFRRDTAMSKYTQIELFAQVDGSRWRDVREPVAVVQRMIDACKGDDSSEHTE